MLRHPGVIARLDRAIPYAAVHRFHHRRLWNTGLSAFADDDNGVRGYLDRTNER
jgi:hypothetical protein